MNRKKIAAIVLALLLLGGGAAWWFNVPTRLGWVEARHDTTTLYGNVDIRQVQLGFRVQGRIAEVKVDEGDTVKAGDLIALLDAKPYRDAVAAAEAQVQSLRSTLDKLEAGPREAEIARSRALLAESQADLQNAELAHDRAERLRPNGAVSQASLDQARALRDMARARVQSAQEALKLLEEGNRLEDISSARANLQAAEASLESSKTSLADTELRAPSDGIVLSRVREAGAIVAPSDIVYAISLTGDVWVRAYISEPDLGRIHPGLIVDVTSDTAPDKAYKGRIGFISPVAEFTPKSVETPDLRTDLVYRLRVIIDEPDTALRQGMPVTIRLPDATSTARTE
ncbi:MAG: secretion protein HlyD [Microvirga sp.]